MPADVMGPAGEDLVERIDALLPQTQCTRCGFDGCRPYARSLAQGATAVNRCPPGGAHVIGRLSALLGVPVLPLDPTCGTEEPPRVATVIEADCIGCAKCIDACPTDAIAGARKWLHAVIEADCSGCELCIPACPVDCIVMVAAPGLPATPLDGPAVERRAGHYRRLHDSRRQRLARNQQRWRDALRARLAGAGDPGSAGP